MKNEFFAKRNAVTSISRAQVVNAKAEERECHLCGNCHNVQPSKCSKVADIYKKNIADYDFITDGYQSFDEFGDCDVLVVEKCNNYVPMAEQKRSKKALLEVKKLREQLACSYFDAPTPEDAYLLQVELYERGHLKINENDLPSQKVINIMKQRIRK
ncbi:MAG: hypothetical protein IJL74_02595 [Bacilli bacterium]|nr:hypothetical protein [Bacilli bacterium]